MALVIEAEETNRLARELAELTGESVIETVTRALAQRLERERQRRDEAANAARHARIHELLERMRSYPVLDPRPADELLGYNEFGTFE